MTVSVAVARWELTLRLRTPGTSSVMPNGGCFPGRLPRLGLAQATISSVGEFLLADADRGSPWTEIADIIIYPRLPRSRGREAAGDRLARALVRHPGCAVAVIGGPRWCAVAARDGTVIRLLLIGGGSSQPTTGCAAGAVWSAVRESVAVGGCLAHAWLVSGQSLALLNGARLRVTASGRDRRWAACGQASGVPFLFGTIFEGPEAGGWPASRARTWPASDAPIAV